MSWSLVKEEKVSRKRKAKDDKPSLWEAIKILWKMERDIRKIEKRRISDGQKKKRKAKN